MLVPKSLAFMAMKIDFIEADEHTYIFTGVGAKRDGDSGVGEPTARTRLVESELTVNPNVKKSHP